MNAQKFNHLLRKIKYDKSAVTSIYDEYYLKLKEHIRASFGKIVNPEDIAQEVFLKLMSLNEPAYVRHPTSWLYKMADNRVYDIVRKRIPEAQLIDALHGEFDIDNTITKEDIKNALRHVDPLTQRILYMHHWEGYVYRDIAEILNLSGSNVRAKVSRAYKILKKYL